MFRFRLASVLRHRQRRVDACQRTVAAAMARLQSAQATAAALAQELDVSRRRAAADRQGELSAPDLERQLAWHEDLAKRQRGLELAVVEAGAAEREALQRLQQAWQEREVLIQLQERQRQQWLGEAMRRERRALDEVAAVQAALAMLSPGGGRAMAVAAASGHLSAERDEI